MDNKNEVLRKNLTLMYQTEVAALICLVLAIIPLVNIIAVLVAAITAVIGIVALVRLRNIHSDYMNALAALAIAFLLQLFGNGEGGFASAMSTASSIAGLFQTYFFIRATNSLLAEVGCDDVILLGDKAWKYTLVCTIVALVCNVLALALLPLAWMIVSLAASIAALVVYLKYMKRSSEAF